MIMSTNLMAGAGKGTIIFPQELFPLEGFCGIHDDPAARVLVLRQGQQVAIAALELVMLSPELIQRVKGIVSVQTGTAPENIWVHVTHAISTPHPPRENEAKLALYTQAVKAAVTEAAKRAADSLRPAILRVNQCYSSVNCNRDVETSAGWWINLNPQGKSNHKVTVLRFDDETGTPIGSLISYGVKPCAIDNSQMAENKRLISSDVPGLACQLLENELGAPCLFCMSAAGDQVPREQALLEEVQADGTVKKIDLGVAAGLEIVERLGHELAGDILPALETAAPAETGEILCGKTIVRWQGKGRIPMQPRKSVEWQPEGELEVSAKAIAFGEIALVGCKPEVNTLTEEQLQAASPYRYTVLVSMVDGGQKYMPDVGSYERITWEAQNSPMMPGAAEAWVEETVRLLEEIKSQKE